MSNQITTFLDPAQMPSRNNQDQQTFDNFMALVMQLLPTWGSEVNTALANFNYLMAGGVYGISYTFDGTSQADGDPGPGKLRLSSATQNASTVLRLDLLNSGTQDFTSIIDTFDASTSAIKGSIRLVKQGDTTKWLTFDVTARAAPSGYRNITVASTGNSSPSPFTNGDAVLLFFQRNGDKGDTGPSVVAAKFSDQKSSGTAGGASVGGDITQTRTFNTAEYNNIPGASLSGNTLTLTVAGKYRFRGRAPACGVGQHQAFLFCTTDSTYVALGSSAFSAASGSSSDSFFTTELTIASAKSYTVRHYMATTVASTGLGTSGGSPQQNVFTTLEVEKI